MSKAFTRESDDISEEPIRARASPPLPFGAKNYLMAQGARRLQAELDRLFQVERPKLAEMSVEPDVRRQLRALDERISYLQESLRTATVVSPPPDADGRVRFGASVTVRKRNGEEEQYRIVSVDETDIDRGWVSWLSPIAKALLNSKVGERVPFKFPSGEEELEIVSVNYDA